MLLITLFYPSCKRVDSKVIDINENITDSVLAPISKLIDTESSSNIELLNVAQQEILDSQSYYRLELYKGITNFLEGNNSEYKLLHKRAANSLSRDIDSLYVEGVYWNHKGINLASNGQIDSAIACYERSCANMFQTRKWEAYFNVSINLAYIYKVRGDLISSEKIFRRALFVADSVGTNSLDETLLTGLGVMYADMDDYYQAEKLARLYKWNYFAMGLIVMMVVLLILYRAYHKNTYLIKQLELERSLMLLRMENIRNRVSPHFIFNVLNRELKVNNDGVRRLLKLMRTNLDLCERYIISLREEIDFINNYVEIERKAIGHDFNYEVNIDENIDLDNYSLPSMMVQIFVENALKHGLRGTIGEKLLRLNVVHNDNSLEILIENNGVSHGVQSGRIGTGIKVVMQTIQILNNRNSSKIKFDYGMLNDRNLWTVKISIPDGYNFSIKT